MQFFKHVELNTKKKQFKILQAPGIFGNFMQNYVFVNSSSIFSILLILN